MVDSRPGCREKAKRVLGLIAGSQTHLGICDERKYEKEAPQNINGTGRKSREPRHLKGSLKSTPLDHFPWSRIREGASRVSTWSVAEEGGAKRHRAATADHSVIKLKPNGPTQGAAMARAIPVTLAGRWWRVTSGKSPVHMPPLQKRQAPKLFVAGELETSC